MKDEIVEGNNTREELANKSRVKNTGKKNESNFSSERYCERKKEGRESRTRRRRRKRWSCGGAILMMALS